MDEIYQEMLDCFAQRTGTDPDGSCDLAARLYAVAAQVYGLYTQADWVKRQCFPQTAQGEYLDHHAQLRGLTRRQAARAQGVLRFSITQPAQTRRIIPAGTVCMTADLVRVETVEEGAIPAGKQECDVFARAVEAGSAGNVAAGSIVSLAVAPVGVSACSNPKAFSGGTDAEDDETLRARVLDTYRRLPNGANAAFYQQGALSFEQVAAAAVLPRARGQGTVDVVVAAHSGAPEQALLNELTDYFQQRREIAVDVQVRAPELAPVQIAVQVAPAQGQDSAAVLARVRQALTGWFTGDRLGEDVLLADLGSVIYGCEGVKNYKITAPDGDVAMNRDQLPTVQSLSVEEMG